MRRHSRLHPILALLGLAVVMGGMGGLFAMGPASADSGGVAISGSFYRQEFEIAQGSSAAGPSIYVVVFNNSSNDKNIRMVTEAPSGVNLYLSHDDFTLAPGQQQKVMVEVDVTQDAVPGSYELFVTAESYKQSEGGIQVMGAAGQRAHLTVTGEAGRIMAKALSPDGEPVQAVIRLFKLVNGNRTEVSYTETGVLEDVVSPGSFVVEAYVGGEKLDEQSFEVHADEEKTITLVVGTIYFANFGVVPYYQTTTGNLAFAKIIYMVRNLYEPVNNVEILLHVSRNERPLENMSMVSISTLENGNLELSTNYVPANGWADGHYSFQLWLDVGGENYVKSSIQHLDVAGGTAVHEAGSSNGSVSWMVIGIVLGWVILGGVLVYAFVRRGTPHKKAKRIQFK